MKRFAFLLIVFIGTMAPVFGNAQDSSSEKIKALAQQEISSMCKECKITVILKWVPKMIRHLDYRQITDIQFVEVGLPKGYQTARVVYREKGEMTSREVQLLIKINKPLPVASRRIERNEVIYSEDLVIRMTDITRLQRMPVSSKQKIVNQSATILIKKGNAIYISNLQQKPVINAGDQVEMVYHEGGVEVALSCKARQDKAKGENIRLYSEKTRKTYIGKVLNSDKVLWEMTL